MHYYLVPLNQSAEWLTVFHEDLMVILIVILVHILWLIIYILSNFGMVQYSIWEPSVVQRWVFQKYIRAPKADPKANRQLELIWTIYPIFIITAMVFYSISILFTDINQGNKFKALDTVVVKTIGRQWYWVYEFNVLNIFDDHNQHDVLAKNFNKVLYHPYHPIGKDPLYSFLKTQHFMAPHVLNETILHLRKSQLRRDFNYFLVSELYQNNSFYMKNLQDIHTQFRCLKLELNHFFFNLKLLPKFVFSRPQFLKENESFVPFHYLNAFNTKINPILFPLKHINLDIMYKKRLITYFKIIKTTAFTNAFMEYENPFLPINLNSFFYTKETISSPVYNTSWNDLPLSDDMEQLMYIKQFNELHMLNNYEPLNFKFFKADTFNFKNHLWLSTTGILTNDMVGNLNVLQGTEDQGIILDKKLLYFFKIEKFYKSRFSHYSHYFNLFSNALGIFNINKYEIRWADYFDLWGKLCKQYTTFSENYPEYPQHLFAWKNPYFFWQRHLGLHNRIAHLSNDAIINLSVMKQILKLRALKTNLVAEKSLLQGKLQNLRSIMRTNYIMALHFNSFINFFWQNYNSFFDMEYRFWPEYMWNNNQYDTATFMAQPQYLKTLNPLNYFTLANQNKFSNAKHSNAGLEIIGLTTYNFKEENPRIDTFVKNYKTLPKFLVKNSVMYKHPVYYTENFSHHEYGFIGLMYPHKKNIFPTFYGLNQVEPKENFLKNNTDNFNYKSDIFTYLNWNYAPKFLENENSNLNPFLIHHEKLKYNDTLNFFQKKKTIIIQLEQFYQNILDVIILHREKEKKSNLLWKGHWDSIFKNLSCEAQQYYMCLVKRKFYMDPVFTYYDNQPMGDYLQNNSFAFRHILQIQQNNPQAYVKINDEKATTEITYDINAFSNFFKKKRNNFTLDEIKKVKDGYKMYNLHNMLSFNFLLEDSYMLSIKNERLPTFWGYFAMDGFEKFVANNINIINAIRKHSITHCFKISKINYNKLSHDITYIPMSTNVDCNTKQRSFLGWHPEMDPQWTKKLGSNINKIKKNFIVQDLNSQESLVLRQLHLDLTQLFFYKEYFKVKGSIKNIEELCDRIEYAMMEKMLVKNKKIFNKILLPDFFDKKIRQWNVQYFMGNYRNEALNYQALYRPSGWFRYYISVTPWAFTEMKMWKLHRFHGISGAPLARITKQSMNLNGWLTVGQVRTQQFLYTVKFLNMFKNLQTNVEAILREKIQNYVKPCYVSKEYDYNNTLMYSNFMKQHFFRGVWTYIDNLQKNKTIVKNVMHLNEKFKVLPAVSHTSDDAVEIPKYKKYVLETYMVPEAELNKNYVKNEARLMAINNGIPLPMDVPCTFLITSGDVIHSWGVPSLGIKVDAVPGRLNQQTVLIQELATIRGQCYELCGAYHGFMPILIRSLPKDLFFSQTKYFFPKA